MKKPTLILLLAALAAPFAVQAQGRQDDESQVAGALSRYLSSDRRDNGAEADSPGDAAGDDSPFPQGRFRLKPAAPGSIRSIQGGNDLEKVRSLSPQDPDSGLSQKIGFLDLGAGSCSGFLVGPDLFLTNHHCVWDEEAGGQRPIDRFRVALQYLNDGDKGPISVGVTGVLRLDEALDYALLRLDSRVGDRYGWLEAGAVPPEGSGEVKVIQHPRGRSKEIARRNGGIVKLNDEVIHYLADTEPGSSGSPVFAKGSERVIALHHVGTAGYNEGIRMSRILPEIRQWLPGAVPAQPQPPASAAGGLDAIEGSIRDLLRR